MAKVIIRGAFVASTLTAAGLGVLTATDSRTEPCHSGRPQDPVGQTMPHGDGTPEKIVRLPDNNVCYIKMDDPSP